MKFGLGSSIVDALARQVGARVETKDLRPGVMISVICNQGSIWRLTGAGHPGIVRTSLNVAAQFLREFFLFSGTRQALVR